ncbi:MAG: HlyD family efflux transporter periplasmic adaptor subunit [Deltaproteobacteria bacterium]|nr:HlyD family efflux transporter periplasmic adaptor subunit [Deltaproteobacteria bacterium]
MLFLARAYPDSPDVKTEEGWAPPELLPAWRLVPPPRGARRVARRLAVFLLVFALACVLSPWQQSVRGDGSVIAFAPSERPVTVEAPTSGVVRKWHVREGDSVVAGQLLVSVTDNDPGQLDRLRAERDAVAATVDRKSDSVLALETGLVAAQLAADAKIEASRNKVGSVRQKQEAVAQKVEAAIAKLDTETRNRDRTETLGAEGLASVRQREVAGLKVAEAEAKLRGAKADAAGAAADLRSAASSLQEVESSTLSKLSELESKLESSRSDVETARAKLLSLETKLGRQMTQDVKAPRDGVVMRQLVPEGSEQVKRGDDLAVIVPPRETVRVALTVDGNDAALLDPGRTVRVQFEGWPAVQFVGWPSVAVGTFGGVVELIDAASDGSGNFRVVVRPDPFDTPWPPSERLRPGVRTHGWVLLDQVPLGFELWRQLNGFPPSVQPPSSSGTSK